jgi:hypothetical protein
MVGSFYKRGDFAWVQDVRANYVCIHKGSAARGAVPPRAPDRAAWPLAWECPPW